VRLVGEAGKVKELSFVEEEERVDRNYLLDEAYCCTCKKPSRTIASGSGVSGSSVGKEVERRVQGRNAKGIFEKVLG